MASFTDYLEDRILNHIFRATASGTIATVYLGLYTATPSDAGGGTAVSTGGYARQAIAFNAPSGGVIASSGAVPFTASGAGFGTVVAVGLFDALTAGNLLAWKLLAASAVVNDGDTINFAAGSVTVQLS